MSMSPKAEKLAYAKRWLEKKEAEMLSELDGLMVSCGLEDAVAVCAGWQPKFAKLPARFADEADGKMTIVFRPMPLGPFGLVRMTAVAMHPERLTKGEAADVKSLDYHVQALDASHWHLADRDYERALADAKADLEEAV